MVREANRLIVGAGIQERAGWQCLDAVQRSHTTFVATIPPFPAAVKAVAWDEIEWIHGITSLFPWEVEQALIEIYQMLIPGGRLTLEQPDFRKAVERVEWLFGDPSLKDPLHMNRWAWTPDTLTELVEGIGFRQIDILPAQHHLPARDFRVEAYR